MALIRSQRTHHGLVIVDINNGNTECYTHVISILAWYDLNPIKMRLQDLSNRINKYAAEGFEHDTS